MDIIWKQSVRKQKIWLNCISTGFGEAGIFVKLLGPLELRRGLDLLIRAEARPRYGCGDIDTET